MSRWPSLKLHLPILFSSLVVFLLPIAFAFKFIPKHSPAVLGMSFRGDPEPVILVSSDQYTPNGGLISLSSVEEPVIRVNGYNLSGNATATLYTANINDVFSYLLHNKEKKQLNPTPDVTSRTVLTTQSFTIGSDERLTLPLDPVGIYLVKIEAQSVTTYAYIIRSSAGVMVKNTNRQLVFWGQNHTSHRSLQSGSITLYNLENQITQLGQTNLNEQGLAVIDFSDIADIAVYQNETEAAIIPINLTYINNNYLWNRFTPKKILGRHFIFTDRPLYRPGDTVYFKAVVRDDDDARYTLPQGSINAKITRGWGDEEVVFYEKNLSFNEYGGIDGQLTLPKDAELGEYILRLSRGMEEEYSWESQVFFEVQHFRKPEYTLDVDSDQMEAVSGDDLTFNLSGEFLFGTPMANQEVDYVLTAASVGEMDYLPQNQTPTIDDEQYFGGYYYGETITKGTVKLDKKGQATLTLPTSGNDKGQNRIFSLEATLKDNSGNPTFDRKNILVYAGLWSVYRTDQFMRYQTGQPLSIPIKVSPHRSTDLSTSLTIDVVRTEWVKKADPNSKYDNYEKITENLPSLTVSTDKNGLGAINFTPPKSGSYTLTSTGKDSRGNTIKKEFYLWVTSAEALVYYSDTTQGLAVSTDKSTYEPEEVPELTIQSDIPDTDVFLSVERGYLRRYQVVSLAGKSAKVPLPLDITDMPNVYVGVSAFANDYLATGSQKIIVSPERRNMKISLKTDKPTYGPGDTVTVDVTTTDRNGKGLPAEVTLWTIDKALFELVEAGPKDIFNKFWAERFNYTETGHSLESIIALAAEGGGGCFTGDTLVTLKDGTTKPIAKMKTGDQVRTFDSPTNFSPVSGKVTQVLKHQVDGMLIINHGLTITPNHRLLVNGVWATAGSIQIGDFLTGENGEPIIVSDIYWQQGEYEVYNLEVENYHTFIAGGVYVHNQKGGVRQVFKDLPYWNPSVRTDAAGKATIRFTLPDNLTTWVIAAIGADQDTTVGRQTTDIVVNKQAIIRPTIPNLLRLGDHVIFSATTHNFSDKNRKLDVGLEFADVDIKSPSVQKETLNSNESAAVNWNIIPKNANAAAPVTVSLKDPADTQFVDIVKQTVPIEAYGFPQKGSFSGMGDQTFSLTIPKDVDKSQSSVNISLSSSIIGPVISGMEYLLDYAYACTEQTVSRMMPILMTREYRQAFPNLLKDRSVADYMDKSLQRLEELQLSSGGWGWWKDGNTQPLISAFTVEALTLAKQQGYKVDAAILSRAQSYFENLRNYEQTPPLTPTDHVAKSYALSFIAPDKAPQLDNLNALSDDLLAMAVIAHLNKGIKDPEVNGINLLVARAQRQADAAYWQSGDKEAYGSIEASTGLAVRALLMANTAPDLTSAAVRYLVRNRQGNYWSNTFATNQVLRAMLAYAKSNQELNTDFTYTVSVNNKEVDQGSFKGFNPEPKTIALDMASLPPESQVVITTNGTGTLYSTLASSLWRTDKSIAPEKNGISLTRKYLDPNDHALEIGDIVVVEFTIDGLTAEEHYGVIRDYLPAGLVPLNRSFNNEQEWLEIAKNYGGPYYYSYLEPELDGGTMQLFTVKPGQNKYYYEARIIAKGTFAAPPAQLELMYAPQVNAISGGQQLEIGEKLKGPVGALDVKDILNLSKLRQQLTYIAAAVLFATLCLGLAIHIKQTKDRKKNETPPNPESPPTETPPSV